MACRSAYCWPSALRKRCASSTITIWKPASSCKSSFAFPKSPLESTGHRVGPNPKAFRYPFQFSTSPGGHKISPVCPKSEADATNIAMTLLPSPTTSATNAPP